MRAKHAHLGGSGGMPPSCCCEIESGRCGYIQYPNTCVQNRIQL